MPRTVFRVRFVCSPDVYLAGGDMLTCEPMGARTFPTVAAAIAAAEAARVEFPEIEQAEEGPAIGLMQWRPAITSPAPLAPPPP